MQFNFEKKLDFNRNINNSIFKNAFKNKKNNYDDIYGCFYDDNEIIYKNDDVKSNCDGELEKKIFSIKFVNGIKKADKINESVTIKDKDSDDDVMKEFIGDFVNQSFDRTLNNQEKKSEKTLMKKYGKGYEILKKAGYRVGSGLGVNEQGITDPISIKKRKKNIGIYSLDENDDKIVDEEFNKNINLKDDYFLGKKKKEQEKKIEDVKLDIDEFENVIKNWKESKNKLSREINFTYDQSSVMNDSNLNTNRIHNYGYIKHMEHSSSFVLKNKKIGKTEIINMIPDDNCDNISELKDILVEMMKLSKIHVNSYLNNLEKIDDKNVNYKFEIENLEKLLHKSKNEIISKNEFLKQLEILNDKICNNKEEFNYLLCIDYFLELFENNIIQYNQYKYLTVYCIKIIINKMKDQYKLVDYFHKNTFIIPIVKGVKQLIDTTYVENKTTYISYHNNLNSNFTTIFSENNLKSNESRGDNPLYLNFLNKVVIDDLVYYIINTWKVNDCEELIDMLKIFSEFIPEVTLDYVYDEALIPKLKHHVHKEWKLNPCDTNHANSSLLIHLWVHPWFEILKFDKLSSIINYIQESLENEILKWEISDLNLIKFLKTWKTVWNEKYLEGFINKYLLPKLIYLIFTMTVNPSDQSLLPIKTLLNYTSNNLLSLDKCKDILSQHFFPKWLNALQDWLSQNELSVKKIKEIQIWYDGWKNYFDKNKLLQEEEIKLQFKHALILIYKYSIS